MAIIHKKTTAIRKDPNIISLLARMPDDNVKYTFTDEQLESLKIAVGNKDWKTHPIDLRFTLPFFGKRFYVVFIAGKSVRSSRLQRAILRKVELLFITLLFCTLFGFSLLIIYLIKSALNIDIFGDFSLGIWSAVKDFF